MQTKFRIIETKDYILAVSDEEIKDGDYVYQINFEKTNPQVIQCVKTFQTKIANDKNGSYTKFRIIAYQPKDNAPELNLPLLPDMVVEDEKSFIEKGKKHWNLEILKEVEGGYVKSSTIKYLIDKVIENTWEQCKRYFNKMVVEEDVEKKTNRKVCKCKRAYENPLSEICSLCWNELYPDEKDEVKEEDLIESKAATRVYSEEDLREALDLLCKSFDKGYPRKLDLDFQEADRIIQSLKQPKTPKWFVTEMNTWFKNGYDGTIVPTTLKTTTINGKTYLVGKYLN